MRVDVRKTAKLFIGGAFVRSESGRTFTHDQDGEIANIALASRKDARDAVSAARAALSAWSGKTAYNRGQILYRLAEMIESRRSSFDAPAKEIDAAIDDIVWYAGWCDKIEQYLSTKNPVAGPHFNVSAPEPTGVVAVVAPAEPGLVGLVSAIIPALCGGNTVVAVAARAHPMLAVSFAEAVATCDLTAGALNILTGDDEMLALQLARHMDVNAISVWTEDDRLRTLVKEHAAENVKRVDAPPQLLSRDRHRGGPRSPWRIAAFMEIKTVWHPAGM